MKEIPLTKGRVALVDDEDFEYLNQFNWYTYLNPRGYAYANRQKDRHGTTSTTVAMHNVITNAPKGLKVDHIDFNGLNNQKSNLRIATHEENQRHQRKFRTNTSEFKGVKWDKGKWRAAITIRGHEIYLGRFVNVVDAAKCYDAEVVKQFGEFAVTNASLCLYPTNP